MKTVIKMHLIKFCNLFQTLIRGLIKFVNSFIKITNLADSHILRTENAHTQTRTHTTPELSQGYRIHCNISIQTDQKGSPRMTCASYLLKEEGLRNEWLNYWGQSGAEDSGRARGAEAEPRSDTTARIGRGSHGHQWPGPEPSPHSSPRPPRVGRLRLQRVYSGCASAGLTQHPQTHRGSDPLPKTSTPSSHGQGDAGATGWTGHPTDPPAGKASRGRGRGWGKWPAAVCCSLFNGWREGEARAPAAPRGGGHDLSRGRC